METIPPPPPASRWLRAARSLACVAITLALILLGALASIGLTPMLRSAFATLFSWSAQAPQPALWGTMLAVVLVPLGAMILAQRKGWLTWPVLAALGLVIVPVLGWLAWDEPVVRNPPSLEEFSPAFPGAAESYALTMRYSKQSKDPEALAFNKLKLALSLGGSRGFATTRDPAKWREFVIANRAAIEADWAALAPQRKWLEELATFERIGDLTPARYDADIMAFNVWRTLSQRTCAFATLQALDGRRDDAVAALRPLIHVSRRLQTSSRTLVRTMIAVVMERMSLETTAIVLDLGPVSAASRASLAAALGVEDGATLARRLVTIEYAVFGPALLHLPVGEYFPVDRSVRRVAGRSLNVVGAFFFNPTATMNLYGEHTQRLGALAETRALPEFDARIKHFSETLHETPRMKNVGGRLLLDKTLPNYQKVLRSHWETADIRETLRKRVAT